MSPYIDPVVQAEFDEPPYTPKRDQLYAPSAPFAEAIMQWLTYQNLDGVGSWGHHHPGETRRAGLSQLAELSGVPARRMSDYLAGRARYIELHNADRLALALGIPLPLLAENFKTLSEVLTESRRMRKQLAA